MFFWGFFCDASFWKYGIANYNFAIAVIAQPMQQNTECANTAQLKERFAWFFLPFVFLLSGVVSPHWFSIQEKTREFSERANTSSTSRRCCSVRRRQDPTDLQPAWRIVRTDWLLPTTWLAVLCQETNIYSCLIRCYCTLLSVLFSLS